MDDGSSRAARTGNNDVLLTPGPLTTSLSVKQAMLKDWGSRDLVVTELNADIRRRLVTVAGGGDDFVCVPVQGSGTFAIYDRLAAQGVRDLSGQADRGAVLSHRLHCGGDAGGHAGCDRHNRRGSSGDGRERLRARTHRFAPMAASLSRPCPSW